VKTISAKNRPGFFKTGVNARVQTTSIAMATKPVENKIHFMSRLRALAGKGGLPDPVEGSACVKALATKPRCFQPSHPPMTTMVKLLRQPPKACAKPQQFHQNNGGQKRAAHRAQHVGQVEKAETCRVFTVPLPDVSHHQGKGRTHEQTPRQNGKRQNQCR